ncbi:hypothetical protein A3I27_02505 [Candidatus Giovannonibacteria bacterium RIFCSPLOWO2_02_FULL_43_11b]|uniref:Short-chain dehydrogenase n=1 Tax=Candidatus Giovannonibacteria bacterium RIFCSPHIGHO2_12_FULL_43_15 TaxID=1798341 RepID=A0A1F5WNM9_9BACT|nr:MAG: hypothetical protein A3B97_01960 [Candidatus Giovannonibacteria bacterium RIFCSPHIGHO2_02_FULL_43_32]OGF77256.1 MAG: hypothetical protein A3F23_01240 [Candidatus Giovannonibacteria bacterium RIFCSPHIGHO2_12_FULL_43_15]OGF79213.1 MAG: hypothetical protein A3A15_01145 [Candidatus Giovannonibacteria bacterium RIFCSPLOWO2_01_FULL_43_60]OGF90513.1 MAG: hypothetical protein A3I27_02505 [Candidatus Giovannonibacteria bacterium RIFCSPLOWO2_02_FULL_43_11b]OGF91870.1 MAG: hypothetical protein A3H
MKWVIVTGGTRGIGKGISEKLIEHGYGVLAIFKEREDEALKFGNEYGFERIRIRKCDVTNPQDTGRLFQDLAIFPKNDEAIALVNNAGIYPRSSDAKDFIEMLSTNLVAPYKLIQEFAEYRRYIAINIGATGTGAVVNIGAVNGLPGRPASMPLYPASKAGLHRMCELLAAEYAREKLLHINTIVCGAVDTEMLQTNPASRQAHIDNTPTGKLTTPEEVGAVALWLISMRESNLVGAQIVLNGGKCP